MGRCAARLSAAPTSLNPHGPRPSPLRWRGEIADWSPPLQDRKSTRLNSSHSQISDAGFCLKKKAHEKAVRERIVVEDDAELIEKLGKLVKDFSASSRNLNVATRKDAIIGEALLASETRSA